MAEPWIGGGAAAFQTLSSAFSPTYDTTPNPAGAQGAVRSVGIRQNNYTDWMQSEAQAPRTTGGLGLVIVSLLPAYAANNTLFSALNDAGTEVLRMRSTGSATFQLQFWNGSTWTGVGSSVALATGTSVQYRACLDFTDMGTGSGSLRLQVREVATDTVVFDQSGSALNLASATNVASLRVYSPGISSSTYHHAGLFIKDGSAITAYCYSSYTSANGTDTDGTGSENDIDDGVTGAVTNPDADLVSIASTGQRHSFVAAARNFGGRSVYGVGFECRLRRGATGVANARPYLKIGGTRYYHPDAPVALNTAFTNYVFAWENNPATGAAWTTAAAESGTLEFGIEALT